MTPQSLAVALEKTGQLTLRAKATNCPGIERMAEAVEAQHRRAFALATDTRVGTCAYYNALAKALSDSETEATS